MERREHTRERQGKKNSKTNSGETRPLQGPDIPEIAPAIIGMYGKVENLDQIKRFH